MNNIGNDNKRKNLKRLLSLGLVGGALGHSQWVKPLVETVVMPAHAQTSSCTQADLAGVWNSNHFSPLTLNADGTGTVFDTVTDIYTVTWSLSGTDYTASYVDVNGIVARQLGTVDNTCLRITGTLSETPPGGATVTVPLTLIKDQPVP